MTAAGGPPPLPSAEELFEDAPCGYLACRPDGTLLRANRTFEDWTGLRRHELVGGRRLQDLLTVGGRIFFETHVAPLLRMQGSVREIAVDVVRADGSRLPALMNLTLDGEPATGGDLIRVTVFDASDRRRYEQELLRARRREHEIAQHLQRSLLPGELPHGGGVEVEVAYRPGVIGLEVGGDWYDAFRLDGGQGDGALALVVGDVVGRGIEAAATMGQLRSAVRALAATGLGPARLLDALDRYARRHGVGRMTTIACAQLDVRTGELRYSCAGHPPPALLRRDGTTAVLWDGRSMPLDALRDMPAERPEARAALAPGDAVLMYTDGLVERRGPGALEGVELLLTRLHERRERPGAGLADALARSLHDPQHADDACLLVAALGRAEG